VNKPLIEIHCHAIHEAADFPMDLVIAFPEREPKSGDYYCRVNCREIDLRFDVFGVSERQSVSLALEIAALRLAKAFSDKFLERTGGASGDVSVRQIPNSPNSGPSSGEI
jgi:hypothetical protein